MNITVEQYVTGLERTALELPKVLAAWDELDPELCAEYADQLAWLVDAQSELWARVRHRQDASALAARIAQASATIIELRGAIDALMGVSVLPLIDETAHVNWSGHEEDCEADLRFAMAA